MTGGYRTSKDPLEFLSAVVRFNLFDIDHVFSATASYKILIVLLGAGALVAVPRLAEAASSLIGVDPLAGQVVLSLTLATSIPLVRRRLRPEIDRVFFKEGYALDHGIVEPMRTGLPCQARRGLACPQSAHKRNRGGGDGERPSHNPPRWRRGWDSNPRRTCALT